jgi:hypothetical protein
MRKFLPWILGALLGIILSGAIAGIFFLRAIFRPQADPQYELVAISWGKPMNQDSFWIYQVQVIATDSDHDGIFDVSARTCIGASNYFQDMGTLGTAADMGDATRRFGTIHWLTDRITVSGEDGVKATLMRDQLEKHR